jgi:hypothetical protein
LARTSANTAQTDAVPAAELLIQEQRDLAALQWVEARQNATIFRRRFAEAEERRRAEEAENERIRETWGVCPYWFRATRDALDESIARADAAVAANMANATAPPSQSQQVSHSQWVQQQPLQQPPATQAPVLNDEDAPLPANYGQPEPGHEFPKPNCHW